MGNPFSSVGNAAHALSGLGGAGNGGANPNANNGGLISVFQNMMANKNAKAFDKMMNSNPTPDFAPLSFMGQPAPDPENQVRLPFYGQGAPYNSLGNQSASN